MDKPIGFNKTTTIGNTGEVTVYEVPADCKFEYFVQLWSLAAEGSSNAIDAIYLYRYRDWDGSGFPPSVRIYSYIGQNVVQVSNARGSDLATGAAYVSPHNTTPQFTIVPGDKIVVNVSSFTSTQDWLWSMMVIARKIKY